MPGLGLWTPKPRRITLSANQARGIYPPSGVRSVEIGNATPDDLRLYEDPNDDTTYCVIAAGYRYTIVQSKNFDPTQIAFYLKAVADGTAVLVWLP